MIIIELFLAMLLIVIVFYLARLLAKVLKKYFGISIPRLEKLISVLRLWIVSFLLITFLSINSV